MRKFEICPRCDTKFSPSVVICAKCKFRTDFRRLDFLYQFYTKKYIITAEENNGKKQTAIRSSFLSKEKIVVADIQGIHIHPKADDAYVEKLLMLR